MTAHAATAAATMAPRAGTRDAVVSARCCQASAQCPTHTGKGMKIRTTRPVHTARTPTAARLGWSGASARVYAVAGNDRAERQAEPQSQPGCPSLHHACVRLQQLLSPHGDRERRSREGREDDRRDSMPDADGRGQEGYDLPHGARAKGRDQPYRQPIPEPEPVQRRGVQQCRRAFLARRMRPAQMPGTAPGAGRQARQYRAQRGLGVELPARASASNSRDRRIALRSE